MQTEISQNLATVEDRTDEPATNLQLRSYQLEMLEMSMRQNIVVAMDTGSGKTFIAVSRINVELERCSAEKLAWFLTPNVALADQQHNVLAKHLPGFQTRLLTGADGVERWSDQRIWDQVLHNIRVVVSTYQVLLDALIHGFVRMTRLAVVVFDEAHHCRANHPANRIMQDFYASSLIESPLEVPGILGLTASPVINGRHGGLEIIESNLHAITRTPNLHRDELFRHVHQPKLVKLLYPLRPLRPFDIDIPLSLRSLRHLYANFDIEQDPYMIKLRANTEKEHSLLLRKVLLSRETYCNGQIKGFLGKAENIYTELGPWATEYFIKSCIKKFQTRAGHDVANFALDDAEKTYLQSLLETSITFDEQDILDDSRISPKVKKLITFLEAESSANFSGLVFVETRACVAVLSHLLSKHVRVKDAFTISTFVGASKIFGKKMGIGELIDIKNQKSTLEDLRLGRRNLVISTSALEEGIDVTVCNQVVCFQVPPNLKSFIQRRGRARKSESTYAIMFEEGSSSNAMSMWQDLEVEMRQLYMDEMRCLQQIQNPEQEEKGDREFLIPSTGAKLKLDDAVRHLSHFCATLPQTQFVDSRPAFIFSETDVNSGAKAVTARVVLPNSVDISVREAHSIFQWTSKKFAKMDAAFEAYTALYQAGLVNDHLLPLRFDPEKDEARSTVEKRPSLVEVPAQLNVWSEFVSKDWQRQSTLYESSVLIQHEGVTVSQFLAILPLRLPHVISFEVFWDATKSFGVVIRPLRSAPFYQERLELTRKCTALLLRSIYSHRMSADNDFACVFVPANVEDLSTWLEAAGGSNPANTIPISDMLHSQVGLIRDLQCGRLPYIFHGIESIPSDDPDNLLRGMKAMTNDYVADCLYLKVSKLPKRSDFLHEILSHVSEYARVAGLTNLPASQCEVDKLPFEFSRFTMFIPSIMHQIELHLAAEYCRSRLLSSVQINDLNLVVNAISASAARERTDYQRLEFLGDSILKFMTSLTIMAENLNWHEGFLSGKKDHTVSNARLASSALQVGLAQYIQTISFTGHRWRPLYNSSLMAAELKPPREMSTKTLADVVEALIGASLVDGGLAKALKCLAVFIPEIPWAPLSQQILKLYNSYDVGLHYPPHFFQLEKLIDYNFTAKALLVEALTHPSHHGPNASASYQRLEFLGDSILDNIVVTVAYSHEPPLPTLSLHLLRTALVNASFLAVLCLTHSVPTTRCDPIQDPRGNVFTSQTTSSLQIWRFMRHSQPQIAHVQQSCLARYNSLSDQILAELRRGKRYPWALLAQLEAPKFFSDLIESLLGAIYIDSQGSFEDCKSFLEHLGLTNYLKRALSGEMELLHPKEEIGQLANMETVEYDVTKEAVEEGNEEQGIRLNCTLRIGKREVVSVGGGLNRIEVETRAADEAVKILKAKMEAATPEVAASAEAETKDVEVEDVGAEEIDRDEIDYAENPSEATTTAEHIPQLRTEREDADSALGNEPAPEEKPSVGRCISM